MKKILLLFTIFTLSIHSNAQDVKIKKDNILVDKVKIGSIEKKGNWLMGTTYYVKNNNGDRVFTFSKKYANSVLYPELIKYGFDALIFEDNSFIAISDEKYSQDDEEIAEYIVKYGLLDEKGVNKESVLKLISNSDTVTGSIKSTLEKESVLRKDIDFQVARVSKNYAVFIHKTNKYNDHKLVYDIYQFDSLENDHNDKTLIGYAEQKQDSEGKSSYTLFNSKGVPLAYFTSGLNGSRYFHFKPGKEVKRFGINSNSSAEVAIETMALDLIRYDNL